MPRSVSEYIMVTARVHKEDHHYVALCEELDISSFGDSVGEAFEALTDAIDTHLRALGELGELHDFLKSKSVKVMRGGSSTAKSKRITSMVKATEDEFVSTRRIPVGA